MSRRVLAEHGLVLSKVSNGRNKVIIGRPGLHDLGTLLLDHVLDEFVERSLPATGTAVVCRALDGPEHTARLVLGQTDHQVLEHTARQVVPALHRSVLQCGGEQFLRYQRPAVYKLVPAGGTLAHLGLTLPTYDVTFKEESYYNLCY